MDFEPIKELGTKFFNMLDSPTKMGRGEPLSKLIRYDIIIIN